MAAALAAVAGRAPFGDARRPAGVAARRARRRRRRGRAGSAEGIEEDPERLAAVRERRQLLRDLRRKYGDDLAEVIAYGEQAPAGGSTSWPASRSGPPRSTASGARPWPPSGGRREAVGRARRAAAPELAAAVTERLRELALPHATIGVEVGEHADDHPGDRVQFLLAANPGTPLQPLTKVASGGELARAMLALRLVLSDERDDAARTLVFDEVDAGIGGTAATAVGRALAEVGRAPPGPRRHPPGPGRRAGDDAGRRDQDGRRRRHHGHGRGRRRRRPRRRAGPDAVRHRRRRGRPPPRPRAPRTADRAVLRS